MPRSPRRRRGGHRQAGPAAAAAATATSLADLPAELIVELAKWLRRRDVLSLSAASKYLLEVIRSADSVWRFVGCNAAEAAADAAVKRMLRARYGDLEREFDVMSLQRQVGRRRFVELLPKTVVFPVRTSGRPAIKPDSVEIADNVVVFVAKEKRENKIRCRLQVWASSDPKCPLRMEWQGDFSFVADWDGAVVGVIDGGGVLVLQTRRNVVETLPLRRPIERIEERIAFAPEDQPESVAVTGDDGCVCCLFDRRRRIELYGLAAEELQLLQVVRVPEQFDRAVANGLVHVSADWVVVPVVGDGDGGQQLRITRRGGDQAEVVAVPTAGRSRRLAVAVVGPDVYVLQSATRDADQKDKAAHVQVLHHTSETVHFGCLPYEDALGHCASVRTSGALFPFVAAVDELKCSLMALVRRCPICRSRAAFSFVRDGPHVCVHGARDLRHFLSDALLLDVAVCKLHTFAFLITTKTPSAACEGRHVCWVLLANKAREPVQIWRKEVEGKGLASCKLVGSPKTLTIVTGRLGETEVETISFV